MSSDFEFGTKAQTLARLRPLLRCAEVLPQLTCTLEQWRNGPDALLDAATSAGWDDRPLIVRSSAAGEDSLDASHAGEYESVLNVVGREALRAAVQRVADSYGEGDARDELLVQPMLCDVRLAGVALTSDLDTLAEYFIVNFDRSGATDAVTSGQAAGLSTWVRFKRAPTPIADPDMARVVEACLECERVTGTDHLDVEFAITEDGRLYIMQARPIVVAGKRRLGREFALGDGLMRLHRKLTKLSAPHPRVLGNRLILGVMPDWNPAEIIGIRPRHLATTLYRELVTDSVWAYQRDNYGYRNLRSHPLMKMMLGVPYIDVRVSFSSFVPADLHESIASKLVDHYLDRLALSPHNHDKVE